MCNSNLIIPSSNCNPKSVDVFFLNGFDPRDHELLGGAFPSRLWKHHLAICYLVGRIAVEQATGTNGNEWVAIRQEDIWPLFGGHTFWNEIRKEFIRHEILECTNGFKEGEYPKGYRLLPPLNGNALTSVKVENEKLISKILEFEGRPRTLKPRVTQYLDRLARKAGYSSYVAYMCSSHWSDFRSKNIGQLCFCCGLKKKILQLHHVTYDRLGCELPIDVVTVCIPCHVAIHVIAKSGVPLIGAHLIARNAKNLIS